MFIGHYGVGLALKKADKKISLGILFLAVTLIDILHYIFVLIGIESIEIVPGFTKWIPLKGINPITHSLAGMAGWALLTFIFVLIFGAIRKKNSVNYLKAAFIISLGVFSHFFCDIIVHAPDLPVSGKESIKLGFGLWNYPIISNTIEISMFIIGMLLYYSATTGKSFGARYGMIIFGIGLILYHIAMGLIPPMNNVTIIYINMIITSAVLIGLAEWLDRKRS